MSARALAYVQSLEGILRPSEYAVAQAIAALLEAPDDTGSLPLKQIARQAQLSERCVRISLRRLEARGILCTQFHKVALAHQPNQYSFAALGTVETPAYRGLRVLTRPPPRQLVSFASGPHAHHMAWQDSHGSVYCVDCQAYLAQAEASGN